jgi:hypothetical protein
MRADDGATGDLRPGDRPWPAIPARRERPVPATASYYPFKNQEEPSARNGLFLPIIQGT